VITPEVLGPVHRRVGVTQGVLQRDRRVLEHRDPDRDLDRGVAVGSAQRHRARRGLADAPRDRGRLLLTGQPLEQERELVAAQARHGVHRAHQLLEAVGELPQQPVSGRMTERVVDLLEAIEVQEHHRRRQADAARAVQRHAQAVEKQDAVGQARERILQRLLGQADLGVLALQRKPHGTPQQGRVQLGLDQVILGAGLDRGDAELVVAVLGDDDDRGIGRGGDELLQAGQRLGVVAGDLQQHAAVAVVAELCDRVGDVRGVRDQQPLGPHCAQHLHNRGCGPGIILDQQHSGGLVCARRFRPHLGKPPCHR
jgi:hypothetical protein